MELAVRGDEIPDGGAAYPEVPSRSGDAHAGTALDAAAPADFVEYLAAVEYWIGIRLARRPWMDSAGNRLPARMVGILPSSRLKSSMFCAALAGGETGS